jgi:YfiH family protein
MQPYKLHTYFGDSTDNFPQEYYLPEYLSLFQGLAQRLGVTSLICSDQQHKTDVLVVTDQTLGVKVGPEENDIVMTNQPNVAVGVMTGDCLPLLLHDPVNHAVAAVHAGWRGSVAMVAQKAVEAMRKNYGTVSADLKVYVGPCAKICCYEVGPELIEAVQKTPYARVSLYEWEDKVCFDLVQFNLQALRAVGVPLSASYRNQNDCTMCNPQYCSHRRQKEQSGRQINLIWMEK